MAVIGLYAMLAPLLRWWPWSSERHRRHRLRLSVTGCVLEELPDGSTVLQLYVTVLNEGAPTTLTGWVLVTPFGDGIRQAVHIRDRNPLRGRPVRPSLVASTSTKPLPTGEDDGLLWFAFPHTRQEAIEGAQMKLSVRDNRGKQATTAVDFARLEAQGRDTIHHNTAPASVENLPADDEVLRRSAEAGRAHRMTEGQLAAAIKSGHVLQTAGGLSPLAQNWREQTTVLVREAAGDLDAARLTGDNLARRLGHLDELAAQVSAGNKRLTPSESWDRHVFVMVSVRDGLMIDANEGESIRTDIFKGDDLGNESMVDAWLREVGKTLDLAPAIRAMVVSPWPAGTGFGYEGLSAEASNLVGRLDHRLSALKQAIPLLEDYANALGESFGDYGSPIASEEE